jgi:hypothetical protein
MAEKTAGMFPSGQNILDELGPCGGGTVRVIVNGINSGCHSIPSNWQDQVDNSGRYPVLRGDAVDIMPILYGPLEEGEYYETGDLNNDGLNELYKATTTITNGVATENVITVYGFDNEGNKTETSFDDWLEQQGPDLSELIAEYGEEVVNDLKGKYDELVDFIGKVPEDPVGSIKKMAEIFIEGATGIDPQCSGSAGPGTETELETWILDCVSIGVLIDIGIPGLPGLGGIFKNTTIRDIKEAAEKVGSTFEDFINGNPTCGENDDQECTPAQILEDLGNWVIDSVGDIFDGIDDLDAEKILGTLGGIFGPILSGIIYEEFKDLINSEIEDVIGIPVIPLSQACTGDQSGLVDYGNGCEEPCPNNPQLPKSSQFCVEDVVQEDFDCSTVNRQGGIVEKGANEPDENCGECLQGFEEDADGNCVEEEVPPECEGPTAQDCTALHKEHIPCTDVADASCGECLDGYTENEQGQCVEESTTTPDCPDGQVRRGGLDDGECVTPGVVCFSEPSKYAGDDPNIAKGQFNSEGFCVDPNVGQTCDNNAVNPDDCDDCGDGTTPDQHIDGDCNKDLKNIDGTGGQCPADSERDGQNPVYDGRDTNQSGFFTTPNGITYTYDPCNPSLGYSMVGQNVNVCEDPNNLNYGNIVEQPQEPCGDCNEGFDKPAGYTNCTSFEDLCRDQAPGYTPADNNPACGTTQGPDECEQINPATGQPSPKDNEGQCIDCTDPNNALACGWFDCGDNVYVPTQDDCPTTPPNLCDDPNATGSDENGNCICEKGYYPSRDGTKCIEDDKPESEVDCNDPNITDEQKENCEWVKCPNDGSWHPPGSDPEKVCAEVVPPECLDPQTDQDYRDCGYLQCGPNTPNRGQWFPEGTDMEEACGPVIIVDDICDDPNSTTYGQQGECGPCKEPFIKQGGKCQCPRGSQEIEGECVFTGDPCDDPVYASENQDECGPIVDPCDDPVYAAENPQECGYTCDDPNATVLEGGLTPGACGPCKEGYVFDGAVERCVQIEQPDPCDNPEYAAANPDECLPAPPLDCSDLEYAAANPEECAPAPPPETGGGGGGGGGGAGAFSPFIAGIDYTPQALPTAPAAPQKDYMAELDSLIKRSLFEGIV